jgi:hypothetical protein
MLNIPASVSPRQARLALARIGLLDQVEAAVQEAGQEAVIWWDYASQYDRSNPLLLELAQILNLPDSLVDNLFIVASQL